MDPISDDLFRTILYSIGDAVIVTDAEARVKNMNAVAESLTGWREAEAMGREIGAVFHIINEDSRKTVANPVLRVLSEGKVVGLANHTLLVARDGTERPIADSGAPIRGAGGCVQGAVLVFRDQSAEREAVQLLRHRLSMQSCVATLSMRLLNATSEDEDEAVQEALEWICALTSADRAYVFLLDKSSQTMSNTHEACAAEVVPQKGNLQGLPLEVFPWWMAKLRGREKINVPDVSALPPEASVEKEILEAQSIQSVLVVPLEWRGDVRTQRTWGREDLLYLETFANLLSLAMQRRQVENSLRLERAQLLSLFDSIDEPIYVADINTYEVLYANQSLVRRVGRSVVGQICYQVLQGRTTPCEFCNNELLRTMGHAPHHWEHYNPLLDAHFHIIDRAIRWPDGRVVRFELAIDISDRKRAETELRASEERFKGIFAQVADGILLIDPLTLGVVMTNGAMAKLLGYSEADLLAQDLYALHPPEIAASLRDALATLDEEGVTLEDIALLREDGQRVFADLRLAKVYIDGRHVVAGSYRDVTEKRAIQAHIAQSDRLASMGMLAAGVAHEINNPLAYVLFNIESLEKDMQQLTEVVLRCSKSMRAHLGNETFAEILGDGAEMLQSAMLEDMQERLREALDGTQRIKVISRSLSTFAHIEREEESEVDVKYAINCAINMAFNEIKYRARVVKIFEPVVSIWASEGKLSQVFLNLLINAAHAIDEGDVNNNHITIRTWTKDNAAYVEISDSGRGISPEHLGRVFEPFFTTKRAGVGSGLGLAICKNIVEGYGGTIRVESEVDKGTRFLIRLPPRPRKHSQPRLAQVPQPSAPARCDVRGRVLVIDDEESIRNLLKRLLGEAHEVITCDSGAAARKLLTADQDFDLLLCDMMMSPVTGMDLHAWLADAYPALSQRMVFITGGVFTPRAAEYLEQVRATRLEKPFDPDKVLDLVRTRVMARHPSA